jgi:hypothetical protein
MGRKKELILNFRGRRVEATVEVVDGGGFFVLSAIDCETFVDLSDADCDSLSDDQAILSLKWHGVLFET